MSRPWRIADRPARRDGGVLQRTPAGRISYALLVVAALTVGGASSWQGKIVGTLVLQDGAVKVRHLGEERIHRDPETELTLYEGDTLHTGAAGRAIASLRAKREVVRLYPNSHLWIATVGANHTQVRMVQGKALISVFQSRYVIPFSVRTRAATLVSEGKEFVVAATDAETYVVATSGEVRVHGRAAAQPLTTLTAGQAFRAMAAPRPAGPPPSPVAVSDGDIEDIKEELGLETLLTIDYAPTAAGVADGTSP